MRIRLFDDSHASDAQLSATLPGGEPEDAIERFVELPHIPQFLCEKCKAKNGLYQTSLITQCSAHRHRRIREDFEVSYARASDLEAVRDLCHYFLGGTVVASGDREFDVLNETQLVSKLNGALAGLLALGAAEGEGYLLALHVYPEYQAMGIGNALFKELLSYAKTMHLRVLHATLTNDQLPALYHLQRFGFQLSRLRPCPPRNGCVVLGFAQIPVRHVLDLELPLAPVFKRMDAEEEEQRRKLLRRVHASERRLRLGIRRKV